MSKCILPEELLNKYPDLPPDIKAFLLELQIHKVEVSQVKNTWEIYFLCDKLPEVFWLKEGSRYLKKIFPQITELVLKPKFASQISLGDFLENNWNIFKKFLTEKYPSIKGWLAK